jgi:hypothetical protein
MGVMMERRGGAWGEGRALPRKLDHSRELPAKPIQCRAQSRHHVGLSGALKQGGFSPPPHLSMEQEPDGT